MCSATSEVVTDEHTLSLLDARPILGAGPSSSTVQRAANSGRLLSEVYPEVDRALRGALHLLTDDPDLAPPASRPVGPGGVRALLGRRLLGRQIGRAHV